MTEEATQAGADAASPGTPEDAEAAFEALQQESQENLNKYLRAAAELENLRKRSAREVENAHRFAVERFAAAILPVRDSMEAALTVGDEADAAALLEGQQAILRLLDEALVSAGIQEIDPQGEPFDPSRHEAISMQPSAEAEPNSVLHVVQKGYELNERIVRPARVVVARAPDDSES